MSTPQYSDAENAAEAKLQQELCSLFLLDTQTYLERYSQIAGQLNPEVWTEDIQELYRCIHTIKGGAVTVGAEAILQTSAALEDLLSALRYVDPAPPLQDGQLAQWLVEAGELLGSVPSGTGDPEEITAQISPTLHRMGQLHEDIRGNYLSSGWDDSAQLWHEFAEQGFDLVVLNLEMGLEQAPPEGTVDPQLLETARSTVNQLSAIGRDLELAAGWEHLLTGTRDLLEQAEVRVWQHAWPRYLVDLKVCAKQGGQWETNGKSLPLPSVDLLGSDNSESDLAESNKGTSDENEAIVFLAEEAVREEVNAEREWLTPDTPDLVALVPSSSPEEHLSGMLAPLLGSLDVLDGDPSAFSDAESIDSTHDCDESGVGDFSGMLDALDALVEEDEPFVLESSDRHEVQQEERPELLTEMGDIPDAEGADGLGLLVDGADVQESSSGHRTSNEDVDPAVAETLQTESVSYQLSSECENEELEIADLLEDLADLSSLAPVRTTPGMVDLAAGSGEPASEESPSLTTESLAVDQQETSRANPPQTQKASRNLSQAGIQIPVPLERLDRSARDVVETILTMRASQRYYNSLQEQLLPLIGLAKESVQYIAQLRQVQDDYTLLNESRQEDSSESGPSPERYRQGYVTINRLLENSLRLTELGSEAERYILETSRGFQALERSIQQLQSTVEESRLVPFRNLAFRARAILRDLTNRYGKPAQLLVEGEQLELDAGTMRRLEPALLHLLRNAYDHGLESPNERQAAGKDPQATIVLSLERRGNRFLLGIRDDGRGIDPENIATAARAKGLPLQDVSTPDALLSVLTQPGFSSKATPTDLSGRGVGLDVVSQQVSDLGGQIRLVTECNCGTAFYLQIPVPHLLVRCILIQSGSNTFAVPADDIAISRLKDQLSYQPAPARKPYTHLATDVSGGREMPVLDLQQYWQGIPSSEQSSTAVCLRVDPPPAEKTDEGPSIWIVADDLIEQMDLLIESLPSPLVPPTGLLGVSLQADGRLISVLDPIALREQVLASNSDSIQLPDAPKSLQTSAHLETSTETETGEREGDRDSTGIDASKDLVRRVLVVDDAALMRRRIEASLTANGYRVTTATDGLEAWNWLQENELPALVVTDIEMPQMDGFTLIERCRKAGMEVPCLVVSSRLSEEWSREAKRLGATDYLTKGFSTPELLERVRLAIESVPQHA